MMIMIIIHIHIIKYVQENQCTILLATLIGNHNIYIYIYIHIYKYIYIYIFIYMQIQISLSYTTDSVLNGPLSLADKLSGHISVR